MESEWEKWKTGARDWQKEIKKKIESKIDIKQERTEIPWERRRAKRNSWVTETEKRIKTTDRGEIKLVQNLISFKQQKQNHNYDHSDVFHNNDIIISYTSYLKNTN